MSVAANYKCNGCGHIFPVYKSSVKDDFPLNVNCPECDSDDTFRMFGSVPFSVCQGHCGNANNGYGSGITYHPNPITGRVKGEKI